MIVATLVASTIAMSTADAHAQQTGTTTTTTTATTTATTAPAGPTVTYREAIRRAIADIQAFWADEYPALYGTPYVPVPRARIVAARPGVKIPRCQGTRLVYRDVADNALYCARSNLVVYDDVGFMPHFYENFGPFSVALVLAHEWGHAIQDRAGVFGRAPTVHTELQADCFAGAWTADVAADPGDVGYAAGDLESALAALIALRDAPGSSPAERNAHGSAFDRISAFQDGFVQGSRRCAGYLDEPPLIVQVPFASANEASTGGNVAADEVIPLTVELLNDFYSQVEPGYRPLTVDDITLFDSRRPRTIPLCGGTRPSVERVRNRVYFCIDDEYLAFDEPFLQGVYDDIGDFGVASLLANPWATHVQVDQGIPGAHENTLEAVLQADCYTGGWVAAFYNGYLSHGSLSAGDLDEFVQAYLLYSRARGIAADVPITFVRVNFVRRGFFFGYESCGYPEIAAEVASL